MRARIMREIENEFVQLPEIVHIVHGDKNDPCTRLDYGPSAVNANLVLIDCTVLKINTFVQNTNNV